MELTVHNTWYQTDKFYTEQVQQGFSLSKALVSLHNIGAGAPVNYVLRLTFGGSSATIQAVSALAATNQLRQASIMLAKSLLDRLWAAMCSSTARGRGGVGLEAGSELCTLRAFDPLAWRLCAGSSDCERGWWGTSSADPGVLLPAACSQASRQLGTLEVCAGAQ